MRVLLIGGGGREHALASGLARSGEVDEIVAAPGNPGLAEIGRCLPVDASDPGAIAALADEVDAGLVVVGPEVPLVAGAVDAVTARGRLAFGPTAAAARLEGSKAWMKQVLHDAAIPTARHGVFGSGDEGAAFAFLESLPGLYVVKTDGLAAGKGVIVTESLTEAREAVRSYLSGAAFGDAGRTLVIEEGLTGPELSLLVLCDGRDGVPLAPAQDHKRVFDRDQGPNTGGMGAYSPVPVAGAAVVDEAMAKAIRPTLDALARQGIAYRGILYAGLMLAVDGVKVIEYNVRFGDPECQVVIPRLQSDLFRHCYEAAQGRLTTDVSFSNEACVTVVAAAEGYPGTVRTGDPIVGIDDANARDGVTVFHAGTRRSGDTIVTSGGRVLDVTATAPTLGEARDRVYGALERISWPGMHYRRDIAGSAVGEPA
ncbi:MAG: phosphoribosylamine---glycine ligase [Actinomycetota bacterium]|nr:phosphoribosylamine---glycine ligase [Actinomycetota bacterium]